MDPSAASSAARKDDRRIDRTVTSLIFIFPAVAIILFSLVVGTYSFYFPEGPSASNEKWGQFGDYVGGIVNPFLAFLSLIALLTTITLQRKELKQSTAELRKSAAALERQNFDHTFFQLLGRVDDLLRETRFLSKRMTDSSGREALRVLYSDVLRDEFYNPLASEVDTGKRAIDAYELFYADHHHILGHYFRTLYHLYSFIDRSNLMPGEKAVYANLARSRLSTYELCLLFYNGIVGEGKEGFKPLIEKYGILKSIYEDALLNKSDKYNPLLYRPTAFLSAEQREHMMSVG